MSKTIAISGKGGVGKSTLSALALRVITRDWGKTALAVDADPNATLGAILGVPVAATVADLREETLEKKNAIPHGMSKDRFVELRIQQSILEESGFDLLTMGHPEGPGCYCFVNSLLRRYLDRAAEDYPYVLIDNEAGMEHLSRRTTRNVDLLLVVAEATVVGLDSARRIARLAAGLPIAVRRSALILNRVLPSGVPDSLRERVADTGLDVAAEIPMDPDILESAASGESLLNLREDNPTLGAVRDLLARELAHAPETTRATTT
jgi:CO dehydrogenase maturation factor